MNFPDGIYFWLIPAVPTLYYLYVTAKAQAVGINAVAETELRLAVAALSLIALYFGIYLLLSEQTEIRVGLSGWLGLNSKTTGTMIMIASAALAYAAKTAGRESIAPWVWAFGMSRDLADLEMGRKSAISAKRRVSQAQKRADKTSEDKCDQ